MSASSKRWRWVPLTVDRHSGNLTSTLPGISIELSEGGMSAILPEKIAAGEKVYLYLDLPGNHLKLRAVVRHSTGFRHGFEFVDVYSQQTQQIRMTRAAANYQRNIGGDVST